MTFLIRIDQFEVQKKDGDKGRKYFEKVSRFKCQSFSPDIDLELDINTDLFPLKIGDCFELVLTSTLDINTSTIIDNYSLEQLIPKKSLLDHFDYVMYGKIYEAHTTD